MKIHQSQIRLPENLLPDDVLKALHENSSLYVKIIKTINGNHAILNIGGKKLKAEFLHGVPDTDKLQLVLQRKVNNTYFFRISDSKNDAIEEILKFSLINNKGLDRSKLYELKAELKNINSIFALNILLLESSGISYKYRDNKTADLFNLLLSKGIKYDSLILISRLISGNNIPQQIFALLSKIFTDLDLYISDNDKYSQNTGYFKEIINNFLNSIKENLNDNEINEVVRNILGSIIYNAGNSIQLGDIIFFDKNTFKQCKYIVYENSLFLSLNLTCLGDIDIIIKNTDSYYSVAFYCEKKETGAFLKSNIEDLNSGFKKYNIKNVNIFFYNRSQVIEKIIEIITSMDLDYLLDVKV